MKKETAGNSEHQIRVVKDEGQDVKKNQGCEQPMERSNKSDEDLRGSAAAREALLIRRNFLGNSVSYLVERSGR